MQKNNKKNQSPPPSHFEALNLDILQKQNHLLFQTVNQLRQKLTSITQNSTHKHVVSSAYFHRILHFLLTSIRNCSNKTSDEAEVEKKKESIKKIIGDIIEQCEDEEEIKNRMKGFVETSMKLIRSAVGQNDERVIESRSEGKGRDSVASVYN